MKPDKPIKFYGAIDAELRHRRTILLAVMIVCCIICIMAFAFAFNFAKESRSSIYVVDNGSTLMASIADGGIQRDLEAEDHLRRFHQLFFNLAPSSESQERHLEQALHMADRSAYDWWKDQNESGYYSRLISANVSQEILIDSVKVNMQTYPHPAKVYGKVYLTRESNITAYDFMSECQLTDVGRSRYNPHGMLIERFSVLRYEAIGTRKRK